MPADVWVLGFCGFAALVVVLVLLGNIAHERRRERRFHRDLAARLHRQKTAQSRVRFR